MIIHDVEQNTDAWYSLRAGMPTASGFSKIVTSTGALSKSMDKYAMELAGDAYAGKPIDLWEGNKYTDRGHEVEDEARSGFELMRGVDVVQVGFVTDDLELYGCSPDGLVGDDGVLEIKCLPKRHIEMLRYVHKYKSIPPEFVQQVQGGMWVTERARCSLFFYHPDLPGACVTVERDEEFILKLNDGVSACLEQRDKLLDMLLTWGK